MESVRKLPRKHYRLIADSRAAAVVYAARIASAE